MDLLFILLVVHVVELSNHRVQVFRFSQAAVPMASAWGLAVMLLVLLVVGTIVVGKKCDALSVTGS